MKRGTVVSAMAMLIGILPVAPAQSAYAAIFTVNSTADGSDADFGGTFDGVCATAGGTCTLRAAVQEANDTGAADLVVVPAGVYSLTIEVGSVGMEPAEGDIDVLQDLTIDGAGPGQTVIDGAWVANPDRIFETQSNDPDLILTDMTIQDGVGQFDGGGIELDYGTATLQNVVLQNNRAPNGDGGAIASGDGDGLTLTNVTIIGNSTTGLGGALFIDTAISTLTNVTISGNSADRHGGGIYIESETTLNNVTIVGNTADSDFAGDDGDGGGIHRDDQILRLRNTLVAGNTDRTGQAPDCFGTITSEGHNLVHLVAGCTGLIGPGDIVGQDPMVAPLGDNGGSTQTHALLPGSPAVDAGDPGAPGSGGTACAATDQRGAPRNCDIGAYELVFCQTVPVNRIGSEGDDTLTGTEQPDGFLAQGGNDTVSALGGDDALCLGDGNDSADGGPGNDTVGGEGGNDVALGGAGNDTASGGGGNDRLTGGGGNDRLKGEAGKDKLKGQGGKDRLQGGSGKDTCAGGSGKDKAKCEKERSVA